ncbi:hypothetical protein Cs7R123_18600 [Catellatospora sp. TT07R-123]|uniref:DUF3558 family protein n=1 Tax=Catellatospora sp. TT07R-123 TaxID=2733863 RepID=UPI001B0EC0B9|nr:DUF3558 family protein [Catellatospora sp. TT07R-123]GHJ44518.1 hypothetical protein Cs7R123_18600 [Catellatospora sp. TT07R-123]
MTQRRPLIVLSALPLLLAGCSALPGAANTAPTGPPGGDTAAPTATAAASTAPKTVAVCDLLTKAEAEKLADAPVNPGQEGPATVPSCVYTPTATGPTAQVELYLAESAKNYLDAERQLGHELTPVAGLGDEAYLEDGSIIFRKGDEWAFIHLVRSTDPAINRQRLQDAAQTVAGRL